MAPATDLEALNILLLLNGVRMLPQLLQPMHLPRQSIGGGTHCHTAAEPYEVSSLPLKCWLTEAESQCVSFLYRLGAGQSGGRFVQILKESFIPPALLSGEKHPGIYQPEQHLLG